MSDSNLHMKWTLQFWEDFKFMQELNFWIALSDPESKNSNLNWQELDDHHEMIFILSNCFVRINLNYLCASSLLINKNL